MVVGFKGPVCSIFKDNLRTFGMEPTHILTNKTVGLVIQPFVVVLDKFFKVRVSPPRSWS